MPAKDAWYQHVPPVSALIPCEGDEHRVTWRWGKFKVEDHDLGSERAMLALGGEPCGCLQALQLWGDQFGMRPDQFEEMRRRVGAWAVLLPKALDGPREVGMALSLERAWRKSRYLDMQGRLLEKQVRDKALPALRAHLTAAKQEFGARTIRGVQVKHIAAGQLVRIEGRMDSVSVSATVSLSSDWIVYVWGRGMAVVDGALVVEATGADPVAVRAVRWQPVAREPGVAEPVIVDATAARSADGWRLQE